MLNQGTRFEITLPCRTEYRPVSVDEEPVTEEELTGSETVLFVDDETEVVEIAWQGLTHLGYSVITANDGEEALRLLNAEGTRVDVVITDQTMPGIRGEQMAAEVKRRYPELPVLLVSGADQPSSSFVDGFLSKPYSPAGPRLQNPALADPGKLSVSSARSRRCITGADKCPYRWRSDPGKLVR